MFENLSVWCSVTSWVSFVTVEAVCDCCRIWYIPLIPFICSMCRCSQNKNFWSNFSYCHTVHHHTSWPQQWYVRLKLHMCDSLEQTSPVDTVLSTAFTLLACVCQSYKNHIFKRITFSKKQTLLKSTCNQQVSSSQQDKSVRTDAY